MMRKTDNYFVLITNPALKGNLNDPP